VNSLTNTQIGGDAVLFSTPLELELAQGAVNVWMPEYNNDYLWAVLPNNPLKMFGMLNVKYLYSNAPVNSTSLNLVQKFPACEPCKIISEFTDDGPYLYENLEWLPRAYHAEHSLLITGQGAKNAMYNLLLSEAFNPRNTVVIIKENALGVEDRELLNHVDAILLLPGSINSLELLSATKAQVFPDVRKGEQQVNATQIEALLAEWNNKKAVEELGIEGYTPNSYTVKQTPPGWIVLSEKFSLVEGWNSNTGALYRANGVNTAVYSSGNDVKLWYNSNSFKKGALISVCTLIFVMVYLVFVGIAMRRKGYKETGDV
jgi:hypothetical protein